MLIDQDLFETRLIEAVRWCSYKLAEHPERGVSRLWSLVEPPQPNDILYEDAFVSMSDDEFTRLCDELFALRADLLKQVEVLSQDELSETLGKGRLMFFWRD